MVDAVFTIIMTVVLGTAGAVSLKLAAAMMFGDSVRTSHAFVVSTGAALAAVLSLMLVGVRQAENTVAVFVPGLVFAGSSWLLAVLLIPFEQEEGWRIHSKAFLITMAQCIGVAVVGAAVCSTCIAGSWAAIVI